MTPSRDEIALLIDSELNRHSNLISGYTRDQLIEMVSLSQSILYNAGYEIIKRELFFDPNGPLKT